MTPATVQRARRVLLRSAWRHPFFLLPAARIAIREAPVGTAAINAAIGVIYLDPDFCRDLSDDQLAGVMAHELMHAILAHSGRQGTRDHQKWNVACDQAINSGLRLAGIALPDIAIYPPKGKELLNAEQLYDDQPGSGSACGDGRREGTGARATAGCGPDGNLPSDLGQGEAASADAPAAVARAWRETAIAAAYSGAGSKSGNILANVCAAPPARVRWNQILRGASARAVAARGHDDSAWSRRNRRAPRGVILPGPITYHASVAVAIDTSGSVSDESLAVAVAEVTLLAKAQPDIAWYLVTHDAVVQWQGWLRGPSAKQVRAACRGRGGTCFTPAYDAVGAVRGARFDVLVHLTDGMPFETWPDRPRNVARVVVALIGSKSRAAIPAAYKTIEAEI